LVRPKPDSSIQKWKDTGQYFISDFVLKTVKKRLQVVAFYAANTKTDLMFVPVRNQE
jgi:hypothetical protein